MTKLLFAFAVIMPALLSCKDQNAGAKESVKFSDSAANAVSAQAASPPPGFKHAYAVVNGVRIHYVIGGTGDPMVLVHGFGQNWYMWNRLLPDFSKHFTVIVPDLPGLGESSKPDSGYDKKTLAKNVHSLVKELGYHDISLAGHDIGLMVAYAYGAQFPGEVKKLALMDALLPGVEPVWSQVRASAWWFGFFGWPASGGMVAGREKLFLTNFWPVVGHVRDPFTQDETNEFVRAYSVKGATTGAFQWFGNFEQDAKDNREFMKHRLTMPMLAMSGEFSAAPYFGDHCRIIASNVKESIIKGAGHWLVQENTTQVRQDLLAFFLDK